MTMARVYSTTGHVVGEIEGGVFYKHVNPNIHMVRRPPSWATDAESFDREVAPYCHTIVLIDMTSDKQWEVSIEMFQKHKFQLNRGHGRQYALVLKWWTELNQAQRRLIKSL